MVQWRRASVIEAGAGTGRVTALYIEAARDVMCLDASLHMLERARRRLASYLERVSFSAADNLNLPRLDRKFDIFIEGWSFGHSVTQHEDDVAGTVETLLSNARRNLRAGGMLIIIETLGTCTARPQPPHPALDQFYALLKNEYHFREKIIRTDYRFRTAGDAQRIAGFFFGDEMKERVCAHGGCIIPEWTGIWYSS
ncbi:MAG TPA: class I SAM-dependent methyltransferase [Candidatus Sumerlaeota bacterium]|nr:class I SAM-dependent methyltransferase [Candidatus Sumerlaeota bacterium]